MKIALSTNRRIGNLKKEVLYILLKYEIKYSPQWKIRINVAYNLGSYAHTHAAMHYVCIVQSI